MVRLLARCSSDLKIGASTVRLSSPRCINGYWRRNASKGNPTTNWKPVQGEVAILLVVSFMPKKPGQAAVKRAVFGSCPTLLFSYQSERENRLRTEN